MLVLNFLALSLSFDLQSMTTCYILLTSDLSTCATVSLGMTSVLS